MEREKVVISLGGSLICPDGIDVDFVKEFRNFVCDYCDLGYEFRIVCGGGKIARDYQKAAGEINAMSDREKDLIGIQATRFNAFFMKTILGEELVHDEIISEPEKLVESEKKVILYCGGEPGWSTDYDAVVVAKTEKVERVVNMGSSNHVYDSDPRVNRDAKMYEKISWSDYRKICGETWKPGMSLPFDPIASRVAHENGIEALIIGKNLANLKNVLEGKEFEGTRIY